MFSPPSPMLLVVSLVGFPLGQPADPKGLIVQRGALPDHSHSPCALVLKVSSQHSASLYRLQP